MHVFRTFRFSRAGFTLIELFIVLAILVPLGLFAWPKWQQILSRARQEEVKTTLNHIFNLESNYFTENGRYAPVSPVGYNPETGNWTTSCNLSAGEFPAAAIGLKLTPCGDSFHLPRYQYSVEIKEGGKKFVAHGRTGKGARNLVWHCGKNTGEDHHTINQDREMNVVGEGASSIERCR